MAPRIGFTLEALQRMDPAACSSDARLVWKDGDAMNIGIVQPSLHCTTSTDWGDYFIQGLHLSGPREMRLLALQLMAHAEEMERDDNPHEVVIP